MTIEKNMSLSESKQSNPKGLQLVFLGAIVSCLAMNLITMLYQLGTFTGWNVLSNPPARVTRLVEAHYAQVWVESEGGTLYTARLWFGCENFCIEWKQVNSVSEQSEHFSSYRNKGENCTTLQSGIFPFNPHSSITECIYNSYLRSDLKQEGYFALGTNGEIYYWHHASSPYIRNQLFWFSTFTFPVIGVSLILLVYAMVSIMNKIRLKVQNAA